MKLYMTLLATLIAAPVFAQTATETNTMDDGLSDRAGAAFYTDESMTTMRSSEEVATQWMTLSIEDQAAIRTRCDAIREAASEMEPSKGDGTAETGTDGDTAGSDPVVADSSGTTTAEDMGFMGDDTKMRPICDMIAAY